ncbi:hypothetical protein, partial [Escherichia coli]
RRDVTLMRCISFCRINEHLFNT